MNLFKDYFDNINYVNCFVEFDICEPKEFIKYPTWVGPDGKYIEGVVSLEKLKKEGLC